ncbi:hypothetical protein BKA82DRAFT_3985688 [Pisolithus tinctorius]|nr:hypothetical protein BKA82DRAFT_3985688 [Pisolithus tinctorius]
MIVPRVSDSDFGTTPDLRRPIGKPRFGHYCHSREDHTVPVLLAMHAGGADVFDVRVPFSSPIAAFKKLSLRVRSLRISKGNKLVRSSKCSRLCNDARSNGLTVLVPLFSESSMSLHGGVRTRRQGTCDAGANAFVMEDLQPEEASDFRRKCTGAG